MENSNISSEEQNKKEQKFCLKTWQKILIIAVVCCIVLGISWIAYVNVYYKADDEALRSMQSSDNVIVWEIKDGWFFDGPGEDKALIFYPGAKVESQAYAPLMSRLAGQGIDCFLMDMPSRLAILDTDHADTVLKEFSYDKWYLGGHSLGGLVAAFYASNHMERFEGIIMLASYPIRELKGEDFRVLSIYGSEDYVLNRKLYEAGKKFIPGEYTELCIEGGNHAQFGSYGQQKGDGTAIISRESQLEQTEEAILTFCAY